MGHSLAQLEAAGAACAAAAKAWHDQGLSIGSVFVVGAASFLGFLSPALLRRCSGRHAQLAIAAASATGTGVLLGVSLVHILADAEASLSSPCLPRAWLRAYPNVRREGRGRVARGIGKRSGRAPAPAPGRPGLSASLPPPRPPPGRQWGTMICCATIMAMVILDYVLQVGGWVCACVGGGVGGWVGGRAGLHGLGGGRSPPLLPAAAGHTPARRRRRGGACLLPGQAPRLSGGHVGRPHGGPPRRGAASSKAARGGPQNSLKLRFPRARARRPLAARVPPQGAFERRYHRLAAALRDADRATPAAATEGALDAAAAHPERRGARAAALAEGAGAPCLIRARGHGDCLDGKSDGGADLAVIVTAGGSSHEGCPCCAASDAAPPSAPPSAADEEAALCGCGPSGCGGGCGCSCGGCFAGPAAAAPPLPPAAPRAARRGAKAAAADHEPLDFGHCHGGEVEAPEGLSDGAAMALKKSAVIFVESSVCTHSVPGARPRAARSGRRAPTQGGAAGAGLARQARRLQEPRPAAPPRPEPPTATAPLAWCPPVQSAWRWACRAAPPLSLCWWPWSSTRRAGRGGRVAPRVQFLAWLVRAAPSGRLCGFSRSRRVAAPDP
jgi:hypothetical protein